MPGHETSELSVHVYTSKLSIGRASCGVIAAVLNVLSFKERSTSRKCWCKVGLKQNYVGVQRYRL